MDITMCHPLYCPWKSKCLRYLSKPSEDQYYFQIEPFDNDDCEFFWETEENNEDL